MKNSNAKEKSRGALLFAFNTDTVDYELIANRASQLIEYHLDIPVTVITKSQSTQDNIRVGYKAGSQWFNKDRYSAYELSPYDETLLLDSDYLVFDKKLLKVLDTVEDYALTIHNQSPNGSQDGTMGLFSIEWVWATAVAFKKTKKSKMLFDLVGRIQRNYDYYIKLYNLRETNYRNDYAFAIADNIINGYTSSNGIPWSMITIENEINDIEISNDMLTVREHEQAHVIPKQSIHVMDKDYLLSDRFGKLVEQVCQ